MLTLQCCLSLQRNHAILTGTLYLSEGLRRRLSKNLRPIALTASDELGRKRNLVRTRKTERETIMLEREEELLNSREVARILDMSPDTVNEFARKSILPAFKKGKQWRFLKKDIFSFNKKQTREIQAA